MSKIKNIIFDMGGVLLELDRSACVAEFERLGYPQVVEMLDPYHARGMFMRLERGEISPKQFYDFVKEDSQKPISPSEIDNALMKFITDLPLYKLEMLLELKKRFKLFMLSNTNAIMFPLIDRKYFIPQGLSAADYFDRLFLSYKMGMMKPDEDIYIEMLSESGIDPAETFFIDDSSENIVVAEKLGIQTYLAKNGEDFRHIFNCI